MPPAFLTPSKNRETTTNARELAAAYGRVMVQAERLAHSLMMGFHGRKQAGTGEEFWQFRPYVEGDTTRKIDWRESAKREKMYMRDNEWEAAQRILFHYTPHARLDYSSDKNTPTKKQRAELILFALSFLFQKSGELFSLNGSGLTFNNNHAQIEKIADFLSLAGAENTLLSDTGSAQKSIPVIIDDFLSPIEDVKTRFMQACAGSKDGYVIQVLDNAEINFPFEGHIEFTDSTAVQSLTFSKTQSVRDAYLKRFHAHQDALLKLCHNMGLSYHLCITSDDAKGNLAPILQAMAEKKK